MRDFATTNYKSLDTNLDTFSVHRMAHDVIQTLKKRADTSNVDFTLQVQKKNFSLISDKERIKQVLLSFLENAVHETGNFGVINVHLS